VPDRVLIGHRLTASGKMAADVLQSVYAHWIPEANILQTSLWSAELAKLTANAMLAQRVSSINAMSALCEATGADVEEIARVVGTDSRIGPKFLKASIGFGGSCFQKDILNLCYICETLGLKEVSEYWMQVLKMNDWQKKRFVHTMVATLFNTVSNKKIAILGFAFKKDTGDTRETPAIDVSLGLLRDGAKLAVYDPQVSEQEVSMALTYGAVNVEWWQPLAKEIKVSANAMVNQGVSVAKDPYDACKGAHGIAIITEWDEFKGLDWQRIYDHMEKPACIFDGCLILDHQALKKIGFVVHCIGKPLDDYVNSAVNGSRATFG